MLPTKNFGIIGHSVLRHKIKEWFTSHGYDTSSWHFDSCGMVYYIDEGKRVNSAYIKEMRVRDIKIYTLEELEKLEQERLPDKYVIHVSPNSKEAKELSKWLNKITGCNNYYNGSSSYYEITHNRDVLPYLNKYTIHFPNHLPIYSFEEWKKLIGMEIKKVIGYKLIKEYPGSDSLGYVINYPASTFYEKYPEFWEPVYEEEEVIEIGGYKMETPGYDSVKFGCVVFSKKQIETINLLFNSPIESSIEIQGTKITRELLGKILSRLK